MNNKTTKTMCMVGRFVYEGMKAFLLDFFEPNEKYDLDYIKNSFDVFYDETGMRLEFYGDDYDMVTFMRNKIYLVNKDKNNLYYLSDKGKEFRGLLLSNEKKFKKELLKWVYYKSMNRFTSLYLFIRRLDQWLKLKGEYIDLLEFQNLSLKIIGKNKFNDGVISLLLSLELYKRTLTGYKLNRELFNVIFADEERLSSTYNLLKLDSIENKMMYSNAITKLSNELNLSKDKSIEILDELVTNQYIIIRKTRGGTHIEF